MAQRNIPLENLKIASPCKADWNKMIGNDQVRFCQECKLNVYNISTMTKLQAEDLIRQKEGQLCVRYFRRTDGTILTQDCPTGVVATRQKLARRVTAIASASLAFMTGLGLYSFSQLHSRNVESFDAYKLPEPPKSRTEIDATSSKSPRCLAETVPPVNPNGEGEWFSGGLPGTIGEEKLTEMPPLPPLPKDELSEPVTPMPSQVRRSEGVIRGMAINKVSPEYPVLAKTAHVEGDVTVEIIIDKEGKIEKARIISGHPLLQQAALAAAKQWTFNPVSLNNNLVKVTGVLTFRFQLLKKN